VTSQRLCPDAWVINYINPSTVHGMGLRRYAPKLKSFALCDSLHMPHVKRNVTPNAPASCANEADFTPEMDADV
jgi:alpha-galactosidase